MAARNKLWVRAVWFEKGMETEGVAPSNWLRGGRVFWPNKANAEPAYNAREEPNEKLWRSFKLVKIKFTSGELQFCSVNLMPFSPCNVLFVN
jgi:hypothetical protein